MPSAEIHEKAVTVTVPAVSVAATALNITLWPFGVAFLAGFIALIYLDTMSFKRSIAGVLAATFFGGGIAQVSAVPVLLLIQDKFSYLSAWAQTAQIPMTFFIALMIGLLFQKAVPALFKRTDSFIGGSK